MSKNNQTYDTYFESEMRKLMEENWKSKTHLSYFKIMTLEAKRGFLFSRLLKHNPSLSFGGFKVTVGNHTREYEPLNASSFEQFKEAMLEDLPDGEKSFESLLWAYLVNEAGVSISEMGGKI